jgi:hypothetical protein
MTYEEYELFIKSHFEKALFKSLKKRILIQHQRDHEAIDGSTFNIDLSYTFEAGGLRYLTIIECKNWKNPVGRDQVMTFESKRQSLKAHKAVIVTATGFQRGAIEYAENNNIGLYRITSSGEVFAVSNFVGNYQHFLSNLEKLSTIDGNLIHKMQGYGIIAPRRGIVEYFKQRFHMDPFEMRAKSIQFKSRLYLEGLSKVPADWDDEYELVETCGLDLVLQNGNEIRIINALIGLSTAES